MKTFLQFLIFLTFTKVVLGIELCTDKTEENVIVGIIQSSINIGCKATSAFPRCDLVTTNKYCQDTNCNNTRLKFNGDRKNFICQFELKELDQSGMYIVDQKKYVHTKK